MPNRATRRRQAAVQRQAAKIAARQLQAKQATRLQGRLSLTAPVTIQAAEQGQRRTFQIVAYTGEPMRLYGFDLPVVIDCASLDLSIQRIPSLYSHQDYPDTIVGQIERIEVANSLPPLRAAGYFTPTADPRDVANFVLAKADAGFEWQASIGGDPQQVDKIPAGQTVAVNGRTYAGPVYVARGVALREISFVVLGGDRRTSALVASQSKGAAMPTFAEWVASQGFAEADLSDQQRAALKITYKALYPEAAADTPEEMPDEEPETAAASAVRPRVQSAATPPEVAYRRRIAAEEERINSVRAIAARYSVAEVEIGDGQERRRVNLVAHAIKEGWDVQRVELEALRASRPQGTNGPAIISRSHERDCTLEALQGAMVLRACRRLDHPAFQSPQAALMASLDGNGNRIGLPSWLRAGINAEQKQRVMDFAHRFVSMSALDLCAEAIRLDGRSVPHGRTEIIAAATSGSALTNIFTTSVNARLLVTYMEAPDTTREWTQETDVADFKTNERIRLDVGGGLKALPRGTTAEHSKYTDSKESYKIKRYARQFVVDEQDLIDDNLSALETVPDDMGKAAARLRPDLVYAILQDNANLDATARALFNTTDGNALTTATLAAATLRTAIATMLKFRENSVNLNIMPTHILVPPDLVFLASELATSGQIIVSTGNTSGTERGTRNTIADFNLKVVSDGRLANGVTDPSDETATTGSTSTWYLASALAHTIEVGYLRGTGRAPQVRSFALDKGQWGIGFDVKMDIGAKALDWKGMVRNVA